ncbi:protease SohB [Acidithiobacillus sp.]
MENFFSHYALFLADTATIIMAILVIAVGLAAIGRRKNKSSGQIQVTDLNRRMEAMGDSIQAARLPKKARKALQKTHKAQRKAETRSGIAQPCVYFLDFKGDIRASALAALREEISAVLQAAQPGDEVLLRIESGGGLVNSYGLAAAQLLRLRAANLPLTVMVDTVAASGGYLMAVVADRIVAAPFAMIGSIGVVAQIPNFHRWLRSKNIDMEQFTAGKFKRTVTLFGENTEAGRAKLREELEETHAHFRDVVQTYRPHLDLAQVATGEAWLGSRALELGLIDALGTSDDELLNAAKRAKVLAIHYQRKSTLPQRLGLAAQKSWDGLWQAPLP